MATPEIDPRRVSAIQWEAARAMLALAGLRQILQATNTLANGASTAYTVAGKQTRRVACIHFSAGNTDVRFNYGPVPASGTPTVAAADNTMFPVLPATYFVVDAKQNDTLNFWNSAAGTSMYYLELA